VQLPDLKIASTVTGELVYPSIGRPRQSNIRFTHGEGNLVANSIAKKFVFHKTSLGSWLPYKAGASLLHQQSSIHYTLSDS